MEHTVLVYAQHLRFAKLPHISLFKKANKFNLQSVIVTLLIFFHYFIHNLIKNNIKNKS
jgi:hypothetical protein